MQTNIVYSFENSFSVISNQILAGIVAAIPILLGALLIFVIGYLLAGWLKSLTVKVINITKLGNLFTNPAIKEFLKNAQISQKIEDVIGEIVRWIVITVFFMASINLLGLTTVTEFLNSILSFLPVIFASVLILLVGIIIAGFLEKMVKGSLGSTDPSLSRFMGKFVSYAVMVVAVMAAVSQLGIAQRFIDLVFTGFIATLAIALGLGFGLGSKDLIKTLLEDWYKNYKK